MQRTDATLEN